MSKKNAFTLIELLAVIGIILILMGLLVPTIGSATHKSKIAAVKATVSKLEMAINNYKVAFGEFPPDLSYRYLGQILFSPNYGALKPILHFEKKWTIVKEGLIDPDDKVYADVWGYQYKLFWRGMPGGANSFQVDYRNQYTNMVSNAGFLYTNSMRHLVVDDNDDSYSGTFNTTPIEDHILARSFLIWSSGADGDSSTGDVIGNWGHTRSKMM